MVSYCANMPRSPSPLRRVGYIALPVAGLALIGLLVSLAIAQNDEAAPVSLGSPERVSAPVRTAEGHIILMMAEDSEILTVRVDPQANSAIRTVHPRREGILDTLPPGPVGRIELATRVADDKSQTLAVVTTCPLDPVVQIPDQGEQCQVVPNAMSYEVDSEATRLTQPTALPQGTGHGWLYASGAGFIWSSVDLKAPTYVPRRFIYREEGSSWEAIEPVEPSDLEGAGECTTTTDLWVLRGRIGPRTLDGPDNAKPQPTGSYQLFRYPLNGDTTASWQPYEIGDLDTTDFVRLACGEEAAYIWTGGSSLYSTREPATPVPGIEGSVYGLRGNAAKRPVVFTREETAPQVYASSACALVEPGGRLVKGNEAPSSVDSTHSSSCNAVPWPGEDGYTAILLKQIPPEVTVSVSDW